jgi:hypothetical protein
LFEFVLFLFLVLGTELNLGIERNKFSPESISGFVTYHPSTLEQICIRARSMNFLTSSPCRAMATYTRLLPTYWFTNNYIGQQLFQKINSNSLTFQYPIVHVAGGIGIEFSNQSKHGTGKNKLNIYMYTFILLYIQMNIFIVVLIGYRLKDGRASSNGTFGHTNIGAG